MHGIVSCDCCGEGVVEIKCPYNARECSLQNGVENVDFLEQSADGLHLKETHVYYYQVQAQIHMSEIICRLCGVDH